MFNQLPEEGLINTDVIATSYHEPSDLDEGPAPFQNDPGSVDGHSDSTVPLSDEPINIEQEVRKIASEVVGPQAGPITSGRKYVCIPWPTQNNEPLSEFTTQFFFSLSFPCLFPDTKGDFNINRPRTCNSISQWAEHLMWFQDSRFAHHQYFKFIVHNIIARKSTLEKSNFIVKQQLGENPVSITELKDHIQSGDNSFANKILYLGATLRDKSQYWGQRNRELRSLIQYNVNEKKACLLFSPLGAVPSTILKP
ncbi:hypothetical protein ACF0H5_013201 [Mactra antiquata]